MTWPRSLDLVADNPSGDDNPDGTDLAAQVDVLESAPPAAS